MLAPVYLTFDDGPTEGVTDQVLDLLAARGQFATFFVVGAQVAKYPRLVQRIIAEGHAVGNHTYTHPDGWLTRWQDYADQVERTSVLLESTTGQRPKLFRPPYGRMTPRQAWHLRKSYRLIGWDALAYDWDSTLTAETCFRRLLFDIRPEAVLVLHDSQKATKRVLPLLPILLNYLEINELSSKPLINIQ